MSWFWFLLIGLVAGWIGNLIFKGKGSGLIINLIVGIVGGWLGGWLFGVLGITIGGKIVGPLIAAIVGAIILLWIVSLFTKKKK